MLGPCGLHRSRLTTFPLFRPLASALLALALLPATTGIGQDSCGAPPCSVACCAAEPISGETRYIPCAKLVADGKCTVNPLGGELDQTICWYGPSPEHHCSNCPSMTIYDTVIGATFGPSATTDIILTKYAVKRCCYRSYPSTTSLYQCACPPFGVVVFCRWISNGCDTVDIDWKIVQFPAQEDCP